MPRDTAPPLLERLMMFRYFRRKLKAAKAYAHVRAGGHKAVYNDAVAELARGATARAGWTVRVREKLVYPLQLPAECEEIGRLERRNEAMLDGIRLGFAQTYEVLTRGADADRAAVPGVPLRETEGWRVAVQVLPSCAWPQEPCGAYFGCV